MHVAMDTHTHRLLHKVFIVNLIDFNQYIQPALKSVVGVGVTFL